jgi:predicted nucleic acid-binding protein
MVRLMLDTMVFDAIVEEDATIDAYRRALSHRRIEAFTTVVQEEQLALAPVEKRKRFKRVPRVVVPPSDAGADALTGWRAKPGHVADAIIADTALAQDLILVTDDQRMRRDLGERDRAPQLWTVAELLDHIRA